jgi:hypothetical protein
MRYERPRPLTDPQGLPNTERERQGPYSIPTRCTPKQPEGAASVAGARSSRPGCCCACASQARAAKSPIDVSLGAYGYAVTHLSPKATTRHPIRRGAYPLKQKPWKVTTNRNRLWHCQETCEPIYEQSDTQYLLNACRHPLQESGRNLGEKDGA